ncbi:hypothetical protein A8708_16435 [Paenibacillus oryzisoli]|uniref:Uncharacterized protein n=1 Tax=Paenibacillus oryzisoli TaxID=1850517 RepID=A0A198AU14_9BACL|nr:hypothetical protein A8708_16435 [Paenibacillus oryzisoli]
MAGDNCDGRDGVITTRRGDTTGEYDWRECDRAGTTGAGYAGWVRLARVRPGGWDGNNRRRGRCQIK